MDTAVVSAYHPAISSSHTTESDDYQQLLELWNQSSKSRRNTTVEEYQRTLTQFAQYVEHKPIADVRRRDIVGFRDYLLGSGQSSVTATRKVGMLKTLFVTAINYELLEHNPAENIRAQAKPQIKQRVAFSLSDLKAIFQQSRIYANGYLPKGAGREAAYWLPLLALFTGARIEELAQLLVKDIRYVDGLGHYINITDEGENQKLKTTSSRRRVPVHPVLIACGFTDYVAAGSKQRQLFPLLKPNPRGKFGGYFSNFFSGYLRNDVGITDTRKVFHSFRHTFKDICRRVGIEEAVHDALTGHGSQSVGRKYGNEQYPLEPLFEAIERFEVDGLDLSHLYTRPYVRQLKPADLKVIAVFYGIVVAFSASKADRDKEPFVLALWQGNEAAIHIGSNQVLWGQLPMAKLVLVTAWVEIHREELTANWHAGRLTGEFFKLDPLR